MQTEPSKSSPEFPILVTYRETSDFIAEGLEQSPSSGKTIPRWHLALIFGVIILASARSAMGKKPGEFDWRIMMMTGLPILFVMGLLLFALHRWGNGKGFLNRWWLRRNCRNITGGQEPQVTCEFQTGELIVRTDGGVVSHYTWPSIEKVVERPKGLLFYNTTQIFLWLPRTVFDVDGDYLAVVQLLRMNIAKFEKLD